MGGGWEGAPESRDRPARRYDSVAGVSHDPNVLPADMMSEGTVSELPREARPIVHADWEAHCRRSGRIGLVDERGLVRSMPWQRRAEEVLQAAQGGDAPQGWLEEKSGGGARGRVRRLHGSARQG